LFFVALPFFFKSFCFFSKAAAAFLAFASSASATFFASKSSSSSSGLASSRGSESTVSGVSEEGGVILASGIIVFFTFLSFFLSVIVTVGSAAASTGSSPSAAGAGSYGASSTCSTGSATFPILAFFLLFLSTLTYSSNGATIGSGSAVRSTSGFAISSVTIPFIIESLSSSVTPRTSFWTSLIPATLPSDKILKLFSISYFILIKSFKFCLFYVFVLVLAYVVKSSTISSIEDVISYAYFLALIIDSWVPIFSLFYVLDNCDSRC